MSKPKNEVLTLMTQPIGVNYAKNWNSKFQSTKDSYTTLWDRFQEIIEEDPSLDEWFQELGEEFRDRYPQYKNFNDMLPDMVGMGEGVGIPDDMFINIIIQREKDKDWICELFGKFDPFFVNPIRVYYDEIDGKQQMVVWDGQHTALLLLAVAMYGLGKGNTKMPKGLKFPVAVYPGKDVAKIRDRFVGFNDGSMNKSLDKIDLYDNYVYAVRHNGSTNPWHVRMEAIQRSLEENNMFFTHEKFGNTDKPGAVSRPSEIFPARIDKFSVQTLSNVFKYHRLSNPDKPVEPLEIDNMCHIFRACEEQGIEVNEDYIMQLVDVLEKVTGNTWKHRQMTKNSKHVKVMRAYNSWRDRQGNPEAIPSRCNQTKVAPTWICQAVKQAGFKYDVPAFSGTMRYNFKKEELK